MKYIFFFCVLCLTVSFRENKLVNTVHNTDKINIGRSSEKCLTNFVVNSHIINSVTNISNDVNTYNDVLNDLIYNHFYSRFLGSSARKVYEGMSPSKFDTAIMHRRQRNMTQDLLKNKARLCVIYLNKDTLNKNFTIKLDGDERFASILKNIIAKYDNDISKVLDKLSAREQRYKPSDFHVQIAKVSAVYGVNKIYDKYGESTNRNDDCIVGVVSMSKIVFNKEKDKGLLYYDFFCGNKCAKGEIIEILKINNRWKIINAVQLWVS
ncbi:hypothetical protein [Hymenobacter sp. YC55]|uniref:hypothetical protein n=1 Tax=Hymenobacter sp. YC55 TaxID=3034019 RepID=UPI0023F9BB74|nr:hypothetical protein [Hymenobacter sp. YC55]MDF7811871.1 hypothetical protein [Hymenobacter sp. YC55]